MDFVTGLPLTDRKHDAILVVVDRLTKMTHVIPTTTTVDAVGTARLFVDNVWKLHGIPLTVISDRGSVFVGTFFTELLKIIGTQHKRSSAFHPQTDGQTERVNKVLVVEDMLRIRHPPLCYGTG
jgi:transposase InsO family protein